MTEETSQSKFTDGNWITAAIVAPEKVESIMKRLQAKFANTKDQSRDKAFEFIHNRLSAEIEKHTQKSKNIGVTVEDRLDACISHLLVDILERELGNFIFEFEERENDSPYEIFRDVVKNMIETEKNKWKK